MWRNYRFSASFGPASLSHTNGPIWYGRMQRPTIDEWIRNKTSIFLLPVRTQLHMILILLTNTNLSLSPIHGGVGVIPIPGRNQ